MQSSLKNVYLKVALHSEVAASLKLAPQTGENLPMPRRSSCRRRFICSLAVVGCVWIVSGLAARADDWPQWLGPKRDGVWRETGILEKFPKGGPKVLWRAPIGGGYSGPAVAGSRVYITDRVLAADAKNPNSGF